MKNSESKRVLDIRDALQEIMNDLCNIVENSTNEKAKAQLDLLLGITAGYKAILEEISEKYKIKFEFDIFTIRHKTIH